MGGPLVPQRVVVGVALARREFDPLLEALESCRAMTEPAAPSRRVDAEVARLESHHQRLDRMLDLVRTLDRLSERFITGGGPGIQLAAKLLGKAKA